MNDKPYDEDTEYQLNEDESLYPADEEDSSEVEEEVSSPEEAVSPTFSKKKIVYSVIFVILIALVVYKVFTLFFGTEQPVEPKTLPVTESVLPASKMPAMPVEKPAVMPVEKPSDPQDYLL